MLITVFAKSCSQIRLIQFFTLPLHLFPDVSQRGFPCTGFRFKAILPETPMPNTPPNFEKPLHPVS